MESTVEAPNNDLETLTLTSIGRNRSAANTMYCNNSSKKSGSLMWTQDWSFVSFATEAPLYKHYRFLARDVPVYLEIQLHSKSRFNCSSTCLRRAVLDWMKRLKRCR